MAPMTDYEEQIRGLKNYLLIYDDIHLEVSEYAGLTLAIRDSSVVTVVQLMYDQVAIQILDDDSEFFVVDSIGNM